jgi:hypothetical protein
MKTIRRQILIAAVLACSLGVGWMCPLATGAQPDEPIGNEYRLTLSPHHEIWGDLTGFGQFEYRDNAEQDYQAYQVVWPGLTYPVKPWLQLSGGWLTRYTENEHSANTLELRPFAGVNLLVPNNIKWKFYNYTRYEFRDIEDLDTHEWTAYSRLRSRFGVEFPLTPYGKAWQPKTWYGLADVEPIYRFDHDTIDPLYVRGGLGYVLSDRLRLEFCYWAQFTRSNQGSLEHANNIFQLNIKIAFGRGILDRLFEGAGADS